MDIKEPEVKREEILLLQDDNFCPDNVCIVSGSGTGIGRATAIAAADNNLMTVFPGFDYTRRCLANLVRISNAGAAKFLYNYSHNKSLKALLSTCTFQKIFH